MRGRLTKYQVWVMRQWPEHGRQRYWPAINHATLRALGRRGLVERIPKRYGWWRLTDAGAAMASVARRCWKDGYGAGKFDLERAA